MTDPRVKIGIYVRPEQWSFGGKLEAGLDGFCDFYLPIFNSGPIRQLAVNVKVTGKQPIRREGTWWQRVQVTFVHDGEPNVISGGWILYDWNQERK